MFVIDSGSKHIGLDQMERFAPLLQYEIDERQYQDVSRPRSWDSLNSE